MGNEARKFTLLECTSHGCVRGNNPNINFGYAFLHATEWCYSRWATSIIHLDLFKYIRLQLHCHACHLPRNRHSHFKQQRKASNQSSILWKIWNRLQRTEDFISLFNQIQFDIFHAQILGMCDVLAFGSILLLLTHVHSFHELVVDDLCRINFSLQRTPNKQARNIEWVFDTSNDKLPGSLHWLCTQPRIPVQYWWLDLYWPTNLHYFIQPQLRDC